MEEMEMIDAQTAIYIQKEQDTYSIIALWQQILPVEFCISA